MNSSGEKTPCRRVGWKLFSISRPDCETAPLVSTRHRGSSMFSKLVHTPMVTLSTIRLFTYIQMSTYTLCKCLMRSRWAWMEENLNVFSLYTISFFPFSPKLPPNAEPHRWQLLSRREHKPSLRYLLLWAGSLTQTASCGLLGGHHSRRQSDAGWEAAMSAVCPLSGSSPGSTETVKRGLSPALLLPNHFLSLSSSSL